MGGRRGWGCSGQEGPEGQRGSGAAEKGAGCLGGGVGWMTQGLDGGPWTTGPLVPGLAGSGTTLGAGVALAALCGFLGPCERLGGGLVLWMGTTWPEAGLLVEACLTAAGRWAWGLGSTC